MSRTHHHSRRWGRTHSCAKRPDRHWYGSTPSWHVTLYMHRPGRRADKVLLHRVIRGTVDADDAVHERTGGRKPHEYYW